MSNYYDDYDDDENQLNDDEQQLQEDVEFDKWYDEMSNKRSKFLEEAPFNSFELIDIPTFEKLIFKGYKSNLNLYDKKLSDEVTFPEPYIYTPYEKTQQEKEDEAKGKGWVYFGYENPPCGKCNICLKPKSKSRRRRQCRHRGKMVTKPLYTEPSKEKIPTPPPPPKSKAKLIAEEKKVLFKNTGNAWGENKQTKVLSFDEMAKKIKREEEIKRQQKIKHKQEEEERQKREEQDRLRRRQEEERHRERREYFRHQKERQQYERRERYKKKNNGKSNGRFSNLL